MDYLRDRGLAETTVEYKLGLIRYLELGFILWDSELIRIYIRDAMNMMIFLW